MRRRFKDDFSGECHAVVRPILCPRPANAAPVRGSVAPAFCRAGLLARLPTAARPNRPRISGGGSWHWYSGIGATASPPAALRRRPDRCFSRRLDDVARSAGWRVLWVVHATRASLPVLQPRPALPALPPGAVDLLDREASGSRCAQLFSPVLSQEG